VAGVNVIKEALRNMTIIIIGNVNDIPTYKLAYILNISKFDITNPLKVYFSGEDITPLLKKMNLIFKELKIEFEKLNPKKLLQNNNLLKENFIFIESKKDISKFGELKREIRFKNGRIFSYQVL